MSERELAQHRLRYELPPMPPLSALIQRREAGILDVRSTIYSSETVFMLAHMTLPNIERYNRMPK